MGSNEIAMRYLKEGMRIVLTLRIGLLVVRWARVIKEAGRPQIYGGSSGWLFPAEKEFAKRSPGFYGRIRVNDAQSLAAQLFSHGQSRRGKKPSRRSIDLKCHFQHRWDTWMQNVSGLCGKR